MRLAITGRHGQLARSLLELAPARKIELQVLSRPQFDLTDAASVAAAFEHLAADLIVNTAAYTAVDRAEEDEAVARAVNAEGAERVAQACARVGIPIIHLSTDYVFDGSKRSPYVELDATGPMNAYGRSKCEGEARVAHACAQHIILRTAWVHSPFGQNFVKTMLRLADQRKEIGVVDDQLGSPTYAPHLAAAILTIAERLVSDPGAGRWGTYHAAGTGEASWYDVARATFAASRALGGPSAAVHGIPSTDYRVAAKRPMNSRLDTEKLAAAFGVCLPDWRSGVAEGVARLLAVDLPEQ
jgi:dTDP-4-dehydrorhamnose reductase